MKKCQFSECPLYGYSRVKYRGDTADVTVMFVGESPDRADVIEGSPFVGRSGNLLVDLATKAGLLKYNAFLTNASMCPIPKDELTQKQVNLVLSKCRNHLARAISHVKPKVIVCLGALATQQVLKIKKISEVRGTFIRSKEFDCWVMPTYHPSLCLRKPNISELMLADFTRLVSFITDDFTIREITTKSVESIDFALALKPRLVALDTETQGLDYINPTNIMLSYSISFSPDIGYQVLLHEEDPNGDIVIPWQRLVGKKREWQDLRVSRSSNFEQKVSQLRELLEDPAIGKAMMNGNYDMHHILALFRGLGQAPPILRNYVIDVQAAAHCINENVYTRSSLDHLRKSFTTLMTQYNDDFANKFDKEDMLSVPKEDLSFYAASDACVTFNVAQGINQAFKTVENRKALLFYFKNFVMPIISKVLFTMEENGVYVDLKKLPKSRKHIQEELDRLKFEILTLIPRAIQDKYRNKKTGDIALTKTNMIRDTLYSPDGFKIKPVSVKGQSRGVSIDKTTRVFLKGARIPVKARLLLDLYDEWSMYNTLLTRYIVGFEKSVRLDHRIHPSFSLVGTTTGRTNSASPNFQNIPKRGVAADSIRSLLVPTPGYIFLAADESQSELRWAAHCSEDKTMIETYVQGGDLHTKTAEALMGKSKDQMTPEEFKKARQSAKSSNFGLLYGMSAVSFKEYAKLNYGVELTDQEANDYRNSFFKTYPGLSRYHASVKAKLHADKHVISPLGRVRRLPEIQNTDQAERGRAERQSLNHAIQSASSDGVLLAALNILNHPDFRDDEARLLLMIHDELVLEVVDEDALIVKYANMLKYCMENPFESINFGIDLKVPFLAECKTGYDLSSLKELTYDKANETHVVPKEESGEPY